MFDIVLSIIACIVLIIGLYSIFKSRIYKKDLKKREEEMRRKMYELAILKELGDRVGYSLNIQNIIDIITGSLHQFIEYSAVSYMFLEPEEIIFKVHLEKSVSRKFIDEIKDRMLKSLSAILNKDFNAIRIEEVLSGAILVEEIEAPVQSFFNIPLVIGNKVVGVLTIAHTKIGLYKVEEMTILYKIVQQASLAVSKLEEVVRAEEGKLNAMVESMTEGVVMTDMNYRIMVVNPVAKKAAGLEKNTEVTIFDFIEKLAEKFDIREKLEESIKLDKVIILKEILLNDHFYQVSVSPVKNDFGINKNEIIGGVVIFHDITAEKEIEKLRDDFTSMIVHDLRSPMDGVKKMIEVMQTEKIAAPRKKEYLEIIYNNSSKMLELVNNILDAAKSESGKFQIVKAPEDIKKIIIERVNFFKLAAEQAGLKLNSLFDKNLPGQINFDSRRISQAIDNYISNAIKYSRSGGKITVMALLHKSGQDLNSEIKIAGAAWNLKEELKKLEKIPDSLVVAVIDTGIGIAKISAPELFNKFKQIEPGKLKDGRIGTGLGLVVVKGIIEAHKGIVGFQSSEGNGSTFYFTIPIGSDS